MTLAGVAEPQRTGPFRGGSKITKAKKLCVYLAILATPCGLATIAAAGRAQWHRQVNNVNATQDADGS
jgi:hypothetical protein